MSMNIVDPNKRLKGGSGFFFKKRLYYFQKWANFQPLFIYFGALQTQILQKKNCRLQRDLNLDCLIEGHHADHLTTARG